MGGHPKSGKTHFALTAPGPIAYFNLDMRAEGVLDKFIGDKEIYEAEFKRSVLGAKVDYKALYKRFMESHLEACSDKNIRTIVWDTESEAWEIGRLAHFGRDDNSNADLAKSTRGRNYGPINAEFAEMIRTAEESGKNFIVLQQMREEYKNDVATGEYVTVGFKRTSYMLQVNAYAFYNKDEGFWIEIENNGLDMGLAGEILEPPFNDFPNLAAMTHGGKPSEWVK